MPDEFDTEDEVEEHLLAGRYPEALALLERLLDAAPDNAAGLVMRSEAYRALERYEESLADLERAAELAPHDAEVFAARGETLQLMDRFEEALADFDRAAVLDPTDPTIFAVRGDTYSALERYEEALQDYDRAIELEALPCEADYGDEDEAEAAEEEDDDEPGPDPVTLASRGQIYRVLDRHEEALEDLSRAIEMDPEFAWALAERGEAYRLMRQYGRAIADFNRAIDLDPEEDWALSKRGELQLAFRQPEKAIEDFNRAIEIDPDDWYYYLRGLAWRLLERESRAVADFRAALERVREKIDDAPEVGRDLANAATYHLALGAFEEAERLYRDALAGRTTAGVIRETVGDLDDFLHVFPQHEQARKMRDLLASALGE